MAIKLTDPDNLEEAIAFVELCLDAGEDNDPDRFDGKRGLEKACMRTIIRLAELGEKFAEHKELVQLWLDLWSEGGEGLRLPGKYSYRLVLEGLQALGLVEPPELEDITSGAFEARRYL